MQWIKRLCTRLAVGTYSSSITAEHLRNVTPLTRRLNEDIAQRKYFCCTDFSSGNIWTALICLQCGINEHISHTYRALHLVLFCSFYCRRLEDNLGKCEHTIITRVLWVDCVHIVSFMHSFWEALYSTLTVNGNNIMSVIITCSKSSTKWAVLPLNTVGFL